MLLSVRGLSNFDKNLVFSCCVKGGGNLAVIFVYCSISMKCGILLVTDRRKYVHTEFGVDC